MELNLNLACSNIYFIIFQAIKECSEIMAWEGGEGGCKYFRVAHNAQHFDNMTPFHCQNILTGKVISYILRQK